MKRPSGVARNSVSQSGNVENCPNLCPARTQLAMSPRGHALEPLVDFPEPPFARSQRSRACLLRHPSSGAVDRNAVRPSGNTVRSRYTAFGVGLLAPGLTRLMNENKNAEEGTCMRDYRRGLF